MARDGALSLASDEADGVGADWVGADWVGADWVGEPVSTDDADGADGVGGVREFGRVPHEEGGTSLPDARQEAP